MYSLESQNELLLLLLPKLNLTFDRAVEACREKVVRLFLASFRLSLARHEWIHTL
jgi:hypothetical protein